MKTFSIVVPVYFNGLNIPHLIPRLQQLQEHLPGYALEFIFVDDGSGDDSFRLLAEAQQRDARIRVIKLSRNFGSMAAIQAGLHYAKGDCAGVIAADLQDPPELFLEMIRQWEGGRKVVLGMREGRRDGTLQDMLSGIYYALLRRFAIADYPRGGFDMVLVDRQILEELGRITEKNTNIMSLIFWLGYDRGSVSYVRQRREAGSSRWTVAKKIKLFIDTFINFSYAPIRFISGIGLLTAVLSFSYGLLVILLRCFGTISLPGWTILVVILTFLLGLIMIMLGIIGEYLWRILDESRKRPPYVIDRIIGE
jgi:polyisoprenyl-phosphate glycosyltransferase